MALISGIGRVASAYAAKVDLFGSVRTISEMLTAPTAAFANAVAEPVICNVRLPGFVPP